MSENEIAVQLRRLLRHMKLMIGLQVTADFFMIYTFVKLLMAGGPDVSLLGRYFSQKNGIIIVIFLAIIDLSFTAIRRNDRLAGQHLIAQLDGRLADQTVELVRRFKRYK